jgi:hypothetical protein
MQITIVNHYQKFRARKLKDFFIGDIKFQVSMKLGYNISYRGVFMYASKSYHSTAEETKEAFIKAFESTKQNRQSVNDFALRTIKMYRERLSELELMDAKTP